MSARPLTSSAPAIEVVATLGDSVIGVRHLQPTAASAKPRTSRVLLAAGARRISLVDLAAGQHVVSGHQHRQQPALKVPKNITRHS